MTVEVESDRFQPIVLEPGASAAYSCFGSWENLASCQPFAASEEPLDGCSQAAECRHYTLERNPPTTRFRAKPRRDGRFEVQQFREFIGEEETYHLEVEPGRIVVTCPGSRKVPKSKRFFLHVKHVEQAELSLDIDLELVVSLDSMIVRQVEVEGAPEGGSEAARRRPTVTPDERRRRIADRLRAKAKAAASEGDDDDDLDIEIEGDVDFELDEDFFDIDADSLEASPVVAVSEEVLETDGESIEESDDLDEEEGSDVDFELEEEGLDFAADDDSTMDEFESEEAQAEQAEASGEAEEADAEHRDVLSSTRLCRLFISLRRAMLSHPTFFMQ